MADWRNAKVMKNRIGARLSGQIDPPGLARPNEVQAGLPRRLFPPEPLRYCCKPLLGRRACRAILSRHSLAAAEAVAATAGRTVSQSVAAIWRKASAYAELRRGESAVAGAECPKRAALKSEKCEKWVFAIFQSEPAAIQAVPAKIEDGDFSDFSKIFRGYGGGRGGN
jgi:hypothetical protein